MSDVNELLDQLGQDVVVEEAEVAAQEVSVIDVLADELAVAAEPNLPDTLDHAEKAEHIADQLNDLADQADVLAAEDQEYAVKAVSTEALEKRFGDIMRAHGLKFRASSFEAAGDDAARLSGIASDCRRVAGMVQAHSDQLLDYTSEGAITQFLRRDKSRLEKASGVLNQLKARYGSVAGELAEQPIVIKHDGERNFMRMNNVLVTDLEKAVDSDAAWMKKAHDFIESHTGKLLAAAKGNPESVEDVVMEINAGLSSLATKPGGLLGNNQVTAEASHKPGANRKISFGDFLRANLAGGIKGAAVAVPVVLILGPTVGGVAAAAASNYFYIKSLLKSNEKSDIRSVASGNGFKGIIDTAIGMSKYTDFKVLGQFAEDTLIDELKEGGHKDAASAFKKGLAILAKVADAVYEQAIYDITHIAAIADKAVNSKKK